MISSNNFYVGYSIIGIRALVHNNIIRHVRICNLQDDSQYYK